MARSKVTADTVYKMLRSDVYVAAVTSVCILFIVVKIIVDCRGTGSVYLWRSQWLVVV